MAEIRENETGNYAVQRTGVTGRKEKEHRKAIILVYVCARTLPMTLWTTAQFQMMSSTMKSHWNCGPTNIRKLHY
jgi:hypothetical protein